MIISIHNYSVIDGFFSCVILISLHILIICLIFMTDHKILSSNYKFLSDFLVLTKSGKWFVSYLQHYLGLTYNLTIRSCYSQVKQLLQPDFQLFTNPKYKQSIFMWFLIVRQPLNCYSIVHQWVWIECYKSPWWLFLYI